MKNSDNSLLEGSVCRLFSACNRQGFFDCQGRGMRSLVRGLNGFKSLESTAICYEQSGDYLHLSVLTLQRDALISVVHWVLSCSPRWLIVSGWLNCAFLGRS